MISKSVLRAVFVGAATFLAGCQMTTVEQMTSVEQTVVVVQGDLNMGDPTATDDLYLPATSIGLIEVRRYPSAEDVCIVVGENDLTREYLDDSATLIGCPVHEAGAIQDRVKDGGQRVGDVSGWVLISMRN